MSAKKCAREECGKSVYPIEELKCLDKVWHKQCFKCTVCGMTLNMKNYKGYDKKPYCEPHYPKTVASVVADTPEMRRIAENTRNQSQVKYHAEYEKMKGTKIEIADDPEVTRHMKNTAAQSQLAYTGELDKRKKMEEIRPATVEAAGEATEEKRTKKKKATSAEKVQSEAHNSTLAQDSIQPSFSDSLKQQSSLIYSSDSTKVATQSSRAVGSIADYDPLNGNWGTVAHSNSNGTGAKEQARYCVDFAEELSGKVAAQAQSQTSRPVSGNKSAGFAVKAIYDYTAADKDEVTFLEGDVIVNCEKVDDGWMTGTVQRTLQWGMLPANYVQPHKLPTGLHRIN